jgi:hypothetical protein
MGSAAPPTRLEEMAIQGNEHPVRLCAEVRSASMDSGAGGVLVMLSNSWQSRKSRRTSWSASIPFLIRTVDGTIGSAGKKQRARVWRH